MYSETFYVVETNEETYVKAYEHIDMDKFFYEVSKHLAFADCSDERIITIYWKGNEIQYAGWQPNMRYEYKNRQNKTIWVGDFPEWDH
jgi:hypothetical protein